MTTQGGWARPRRHGAGERWAPTGPRDGDGTCEQRVAVCQNQAQGWALRTTLRSTGPPDTQPSALWRATAYGVGGGN